MTADDSDHAPEPLDSITLVVPARNAQRTLRDCLVAVRPFLESGDLDKIIVVDNGSRDRTRAIAIESGVQVIDCSKRGAGAARNAGWRAADSRWIWFLDADCVAHHDALDKLRLEIAGLSGAAGAAGAAGAGGVAAVAGSYTNAEPDCWLARRIQEEIETRHHGSPGRAEVVATNNLMCLRRVLIDLDGFDESLLRAQDTDFSYRLRSRGWRLALAPESLVAHLHEPRMRAYLVTQFRNAFWRVRLYGRYPARIVGDGYASWLDHLQPILALALAIAATAAGGTVVLARSGLLPSGPELVLEIAALVLAVLVVFCALPLALRIARLHPRTRLFSALGHVAIAAVRSFAHAGGAVAGVLGLLVERGRFVFERDVQGRAVRGKRVS